MLGWSGRKLRLPLFWWDILDNHHQGSKVGPRLRTTQSWKSNIFPAMNLKFFKIRNENFCFRCPWIWKNSGLHNDNGSIQCGGAAASIVDLLCPNLRLFFLQGFAMDRNNLVIYWKNHWPFCMPEIFLLSSSWCNGRKRGRKRLRPGAQLQWVCTLPSVFDPRTYFGWMVISALSFFVYLLLFDFSFLLSFSSAFIALSSPPEEWGSEGFTAIDLCV